MGRGGGNGGENFYETVSRKVGSQKPQILKQRMKLNWNFQRGEGSKQKHFNLCYVKNTIPVMIIKQNS